jgi:hypothetical protein
MAHCQDGSWGPRSPFGKRRQIGGREFRQRYRGCIRGGVIWSQGRRIGWWGQAGRRSSGRAGGRTDSRSCIRFRWRSAVTPESALLSHGMPMLIREPGISRTGGSLGTDPRSVPTREVKVYTGPGGLSANSKGQRIPFGLPEISPCKPFLLVSGHAFTGCGKLGFPARMKNVGADAPSARPSEARL